MGWGLGKQNLSPLQTPNLDPWFGSHRPNYPHLPHALITSVVPGVWAGLPHFREVGRARLFLAVSSLKALPSIHVKGRKWGRKTRTTSGETVGDLRGKLA